MRTQQNARREARDALFGAGYYAGQHIDQTGYDIAAAAPELYEALDSLSAVIGLTPVAGNLVALQEAYDNARAALAKARGESLTNAHLIAAAPELYEALDSLSAVIGLTPVSGNREALQEAYDNARAALAKARGESLTQERGEE